MAGRLIGGDDSALVALPFAQANRLQVAVRPLWFRLRKAGGLMTSG